MTRHFCSYADSAYLPRLKALYASMERHCGDFKLHVLAWDAGVADWCVFSEDNERVSYSWIGGFMERYPGLLHENLPGPPRSTVEHMWTVGPRWIVETME